MPQKLVNINPCKLIFMENYIVSARKYRPASFDTVVGQSALTTTLKNAIHSGRLAHAYLFCGPRGVGKTTCARIFAKTINCLSPNGSGEACNECESCRAFNEQRSYNIHELDAASNNSVEDIRQLIEQVRIPPQIGKYQVFIIDEVHMLSPAAFNAFLKTLEEPPRHAIFILATTEKHKLLATIISRCQIYDFNRMSIENIVTHLASVAQREGIAAEPAALNVIAQKADGGMRDALSIFDQVVSFCGGNITYQQTIANLNVLDYDYYFRIIDDCLSNKITDIMLTYNDILNKGFDGQHFITGLATHMRNLLMSRDQQTLPLIETSNEIRQRYAEQAQRCQQKFLYTAMHLCNQCDLSYKQSQNKRLLVELTLIEVAQVAQGEAIPGSGRSPKHRLQPLFALLAKAKAEAGGNTTATSHGTEVLANTPSATQQRPSIPAMPQQRTVTPHTARPAEPIIQQHRTKIGFTITSHVQTQQTPVTTNVSPTEDAKSETTSPTTNVVKQDKLFTYQDIIIAWKDFASQLKQEEFALVSRMNNTEPLFVPETMTIEIIADNPDAETTFNKAAARLQAFMQQQLHNSHISIIIHKRKMEKTKKAFSQSEILKIMNQQSPELAKLISELDLVLD